MTIEDVRELAQAKNVDGLAEVVGGPGPAPSRTVRHAVFTELSRLGSDAAVDVVGHMLVHDPDPTLRASIGRWCWKSRETRCAGALRSALADSDPRVAAQSVRALGVVGGEVDLPALREALTVDDPTIRSFAAGALQQLDDGEAVSQLARLLSDHDRGVREAAARALAEIGGDKAALALREASNRAGFINRFVLKSQARKAASST